MAEKVRGRADSGDELAWWRAVSLCGAGGALVPEDEPTLWVQIEARRSRLAERAGADVDAAASVVARARTAARARWGDDPEFDEDAFAAEFETVLRDSIQEDVEQARGELAAVTDAIRKRPKRAGPPYKIRQVELDPLLARARDGVRRYIVAGGGAKAGVWAWLALTRVARAPLSGNLDTLIVDAKSKVAELGGGPLKTAAAVVAGVSGVPFGRIVKLARARHK